MVMFSAIAFAAFRGGVHTPSRVPMAQLPDTPAARKFLEQVDVRKTGDYEALRRFYAQNLLDATEDAIVGNAATDVDMLRRFGPQDIRAFAVVESTPLRLVLIVQESGFTPFPNAWVRHEIEVTADASHKISRQRFISYGSQKPSSANAQILPPPGFQMSDRKPADPAFPRDEAARDVALADGDHWE
jgi:hypothetical protein